MQTNDSLCLSVGLYSAEELTQILTRSFERENPREVAMVGGAENFSSFVSFAVSSMRNGTRDLEEMRHGIGLLLPKFRSVVRNHIKQHKSLTNVMKSLQDGLRTETQVRVYVCVCMCVRVFAFVVCVHLWCVCARVCMYVCV